MEFPDVFKELAIVPVGLHMTDETALINELLSLQYFPGPFVLQWTHNGSGVTGAISVNPTFPHSSEEWQVLIREWQVPFPITVRSARATGVILG